MKRQFLDQPHSWTRAPRVSQPPAEYASSITVHQASNSAARAVGVYVVVLLVLLAVIHLAARALP